MRLSTIISEENRPPPLAIPALVIPGLLTATQGLAGERCAHHRRITSGFGKEDAMRRKREVEERTIQEAFSSLSVDQLKPLATLVAVTAMRKGEIVDGLTRIMTDRLQIEKIY